MTAKQHPFHIIAPSPWPINTAFSLLFVTFGAVMFLHNHWFGKYIAIVGAVWLVFCVYCWWHDVVKEALVEKQHTSYVQHGLRIGMLLFILSEVMFFVVFFWSFFKASIFPVGLLDGIWVKGPGTWPPKGIETLDPWDIPLINTLILLLSGTTVTWSHYAQEAGDNKQCVRMLGITIFLGILFSFMQFYEYHHAKFGIKDGIYGANFYLATGFHGLHVIVGTVFLAICYFRAKRGDFDIKKGCSSLGFQFAIWYWHFVDVVWLFLFSFVYLWGR